MEWDKPWLEACDALLFLGPSKGADVELQHARQLGKTIYWALDEIPDDE
jgi:hypothetical protein